MPTKYVIYGFLFVVSLLLLQFPCTPPVEEISRFRKTIEVDNKQVIDNALKVSRHQQQGTLSTASTSVQSPKLQSAERFCFPHVSGPIPEVKGQITSFQGFAKALTKVARMQGVNRILEIGTWYGGGSTLQLVNGIKHKAKCISNKTHHCCHSYVVTMEVFEPAWKHASLFHQNNPVWLIKGTTVGVSEMLQEDEIPVNEKGEHYKLYYQRDKKIMANNKPLLRQLCQKIKFDFVLIDGNEYTGWGEFQIVRDVCKPKYLALHDCKTLKTKKVEEYLSRMKAKPVAEGFDNNAAWSIYILD